MASFDQVLTQNLVEWGATPTAQAEAGSSLSGRPALELFSLGGRLKFLRNKPTITVKRVGLSELQSYRGYTIEP